MDSVAQDLFRGVLPFLHVAEERSFRRGAARLGVTPAAVSKAVAALEEDLGVRLLERTSRRVALTPAGEAYLERCRDAVAHLRAGRELVARAQGEPKGELRVTLSHILGRPLVAALPRFVSRYPGIDLRLELSDRVSGLIGEDQDVALRVGPLADSGLVARRLRRTRWVTVAAPSYLARRGEPRTADELAGHACLGFVTPRGRVAEWAFEGRASVPPRGVRLDRGDLLMDAALAGLGVAQVVDFMVEAPLAEGRLIEVLEGHGTEGPPIHALFPPGRRRSRRVRAFLEHVGDVFGVDSTAERD
ncbi:MAG TPA: LysR family transcriptional regulator [Sandaracinaceae bacterium LLY-WYZ-13_1]|nr:LysR family transcriptional regulator [Sandaracinaceae bacterium LLY-WYZ-13_1]